MPSPAKMNSLNRTCELCHEEFDNFQELVKHRKRHGFKCDVCSKTFRIKDVMKQHQLTHWSEQNTTLDCIVADCRKNFVHPFQMRSHIRKDHLISPMNPKQCGKCDAVYSSLRGILNHYYGSHVESSAPVSTPGTSAVETKWSNLPLQPIDFLNIDLIACSASTLESSELQEAAQVFDTNQQNQGHAELEQLEQMKFYQELERMERTCGICRMEFENPREVARHRKQSHGLKCDVCPMTFAKNDKLSHHKMTHWADDRAKIGCIVEGCAVKRKKYIGLRRHLNQKHFPSLSSRAKCEKCSEPYSTVNSILNHYYFNHHEESRPSVASLNISDPDLEPHLSTNSLNLLLPQSHSSTFDSSSLPAGSFSYNPEFWGIPQEATSKDQEPVVEALNQLEPERVVRKKAKTYHSLTREFI